MGSESTEKSTISAWLCRDFATTERYKALARWFYLATVVHPDGDADSEKARTEFAEYLRTLFAEFDPKGITVDKWNKEFSAIEQVPIPPADSSEETDWDWLADYFLLAASVSWKEFEDLNSRRQKLNQAYDDRTAANRKRIEKNNRFIRLVFDRILDQHENIDLEAIAVDVRKEHFPSFANTGEQKADSERANKNILCFAPVPLMEDESDSKVKKIAISDVSLYQPKYFCNKGE